MMSATSSAFKRCSIRLSFNSRLLCLRYSYLFTYAGVQHDLYILCCSCHLALRRRLSPVKPELFTPFFSRIRVSQSFAFCVKFIFLSFLGFDILLYVPPITAYSSGFSIFTYLPLRCMAL